MNGLREQRSCTLLFSELAELYENSFHSQDFKSGVEKFGLCPLCRDAIPPSKLSKALPFHQPNKCETQTYLEIQKLVVCF